MSWCCPHHHGELRPDGSALYAACCGRRFPVVAGIPDLRVDRAAWVDVEEDRRAAVELEGSVPAGDVEGSIRWVFGRRPGWTPEMVARRTRLILDSAERLREESAGWLAPVVEADGCLLDVGCGAGAFLAVQSPDRPLAGVDISLEWLVVARRLLAAAGVEAHLAAAHAEALPLAAWSVGSAVALDVIEHVGDQVRTFAEIDRVLAPGGMLGAATPNRFSLAAEPHVGVWGVGWLPRGWQEGYVRRRTGLRYDFARLLSHAELRRMLRRHTTLRARVEPASIPGIEIRHFRTRRKLLARLYNGLLTMGTFRAAARRVGPFFHLIAQKPPA